MPGAQGPPDVGLPLCWRNADLTVPWQVSGQGLKT